VLRLAPALTLALMLAPIGAGLVGTLLPSLGLLPALGRAELSLAPWRELLAAPGLATSVRLTVTTGLAATALSFLMASGFCALAAERRPVRALARAMAPLLATPHLAVAIGFAFLVAPSGWIVRLVSPDLTGWDRPPDLPVPRDPAGLSLIAGLVLKEVPYLVLVMAAATGQVAAGPLLRSARTLGYGPATAWVKVVLPLVYRQVRLPVYAVLAFSLSNVEVAMVLAPTTPPPLAVLATRWFAGYDLALHFPAAAAAMLQLALVVAAIGLWRLGEAATAALGRRWIEAGHRRGAAGGLVAAAGWLAVAAGALCFVCLLVLALWAFARDWRFPESLPAAFTLATFARLGSLGDALAATALIAAASSGIAVALALACLENEQRRRLHPGPRALWLLYAPLLMPQIAFLFGMQVLFVRLDLDATLFGVAWAHLLFVLPYVFLSLADPFRALDPRYARIGAGLGAAPARVFWRIKAPLLLRPILIAFAIGFAVSVAQYLPTLFAGAGRVATVTTETLTLASGADRRVVGATALAQAALPLLVYALAVAVPALIHRRRRSLP
jgi:putative thiamine transport system permease protein